MNKLRIVVVHLAVAVCLGAAAGAGATGIVGQLQSDGGTLAGTAVPSGTAIPAGSAVGAYGSAAIVHLNGGQVVRLEDGSRVRFTVADGGEIDLAVEAGSAFVARPGGGNVALGPGAAAVFPDDPPIGEGEPVAATAPPASSETYELCHLRDPNPRKAERCNSDPDADGCRWKAIEVGGAEVEEHLLHGDVFRDPSLRGEEESLDIECDRNPAIWVVPAVLGGVVTVDQLDDDSRSGDGPFASPVTP